MWEANNREHFVLDSEWLFHLLIFTLVFGIGIRQYIDLKAIPYNDKEYKTNIYIMWYYNNLYYINYIFGSI